MVFITGDVFDVFTRCAVLSPRQCLMAMGVIHILSSAHLLLQGGADKLEGERTQGEERRGEKRGERGEER